MLARTETNQEDKMTRRIETHPQTVIGMLYAVKLAHWSLPDGTAMGMTGAQRTRRLVLTALPAPKL